MMSCSHTRLLLKPGEFTYGAVGESEVCAAKIINPAF